MKNKDNTIYLPERDSPILKEILLKFLIIGDYGVGKTAIVRRYAEGKFSTNYKITIGAEFSIKSFPWNNTTQVNIQLWDIAGHERFGYMTRVYYKYASAAAVVFDVSRASTFHSVEKWLEDVRNKVILADGTRIPVIILANKSDIDGNCLPVDQLNKMCLEDDVIGWFSTSAKENINIDSAMDLLISYALQNRQQIQEDGDSIALNSRSTSDDDRHRSRKTCCV